MASVRQAELARRVEEACLNGWPALRQILFDGWLLRFSEGHTRRSNSVNPLSPGRRDLREKIARCETLYAQAALPTIFRIPSIAEPGLDEALDCLGYGPAEDETCVVHLDFSRREIPRLDAILRENTPGDEWLEAHARFTGSDGRARDAQRRILAVLALPAVFAAVPAEDGRPASLAFGAVHDGIVCINLVVTAPAMRRRGLSRRAVLAVLSWARDHGAEGACLPVGATNAPALALYRSLGFDTELYRYHYRRRV